jgi:hypothetical protein
VPGGESLTQSAERLNELLQGFDQRAGEPEDSRNGEKLDRIEEGVRALTADEIPRLKSEIRELRNMLAETKDGGGDRATE